MSMRGAANRMYTASNEAMVRSMVAVKQGMTTFDHAGLLESNTNNLLAAIDNPDIIPHSMAEFPTLHTEETLPLIKQLQEKLNKAGRTVKIVPLPEATQAIYETAQAAAFMDAALASVPEERIAQAGRVDWAAPTLARAT